MKKFRIPAVLYIAKDEYGRLEATVSSFKAKAVIKINQKPGPLGGGTPEEYLANLRRRALQAYKDGVTEIDA